MMGGSGIANRWRELSGEKNWQDLLDPLHVDLRKYIIHYGERAQAVLDAFNKETASKWIGFSRYPMDGFFSRVGLEKGNPYKYEVTKFFYARSEIQVLDWFSVGQSNWMGYVAVATDEGKAVLGRRDILIAWRGTKRNIEVIKDIQADLVSAADILGENGDPKVHHGWHSIYTSKDLQSTFNKTSARDQVLGEVRRLVELYKDEEISVTITGHSLGAAIATLSAMDIAANGYNIPITEPEKACLVTAIVFASPHVGDSGLKNVFSKLKNLRVLRVNNELDVVPSLLQLAYTHVGEELEIESDKSKYRKIYPDLNTNLMLAHQLEIYLHGVAGANEASGEFELQVDRDISLMNKSLGALKDEYYVPVEWWTEKNKGMVQQEDGSWKLDDYVPDPPTD
ncbi:hypothetical protein SLEP1_g44915 [Rubroshorea leprosula]|uniref:Phospholipase A1 n=1 Tax=Rubroshorea leprosula TaxID=152421 RepID=A0AAV5LI67_9ROSI|nr:hypothetical protein SLEP1_g44915 [Rubroshorea leprosula]